jgi:cysteine desulfurase
MNTKKRVYLDHAATTPVREEVIEAMLPILKHEYGNPSSFYESGQRASRLMADARQTVAKCLNADPGEIYFTSCGTESDNWAIKGIALAQQNKGRHIITTRIEHHAVLHSCQALEKQGYSVTYLDVDSHGLVDPEAVLRAIRPDTILVTIMMANNEIGTIQPIESIAAICREKNVVFHTDAVQAVGSIPVDVHALNVDMLSLSGHKFYAPKGVGALYIRRGVRLANLLDGGAQEKNRRGGTENVPGIVGLAFALQLAVKEMDDVGRKLSAMRDTFVKQVMETIPDVRLNGHPTRRLPNNINLSIKYIEGESILLMLDHYGYACSSGSACTSGSLDPSHVLLAIGLPHEIAHGSLRVTLGRSTRQDDLDRLVHDLDAIVRRLRAMSPLHAEQTDQ